MAQQFRLVKYYNLPRYMSDVQNVYVQLCYIDPTWTDDRCHFEKYICHRYHMFTMEL